MTAPTYREYTVEVCPICDIAGCRHIKERQENVARAYTAADMARAKQEGWIEGRDAGAQRVLDARWLPTGEHTGFTNCEKRGQATANIIRALTPPPDLGVNMETGDDR